VGHLGTELLGILINCYRKNALFPIVLPCDFHEYNPVIKEGSHFSLTNSVTHPFLYPNSYCKIYTPILATSFFLLIQPKDLDSSVHWLLK